MPLEERFRQVLADAVADVRARLDAEFDTVLGEARSEADRDKDGAVAEARASLERDLVSTFEAEKSALAATHADLVAQAADAARLELSRVAEESTAELERVRVDGEATIEALRGELRDLHTAAAAQRDEHDAALVRLRQEHELEVGRLRAELAAATSSRDSVEIAMARLRDDHDVSTSALRADAEAALAAARSVADTRLAALRADADASAAAAHAESTALIASLRAEAHHAVSLHGHAVDAHQTATSRLLESVRALDGAASLPEVLDALTQSASREVGRAAVLVVKGDQLIGWKASGYAEFDQDPRSITSSTSDVGALAAAVNTGRPAVVGAGSVLAAPAFTQLPAEGAGLAVPLLVAGKPVAVLYVDQGNGASVAGWTSPIEVLVRHASRCLEGLAVHRAAQARVAPARVGVTA